MVLKTQVSRDLRRRNSRGQVAHAQQVVGRAGEGKDPVHFAHTAMAHFPQQGNSLQPAEALCRTAATVASVLRPPWPVWHVRMVFPHPRFRRQVSEDVILLLIVSAHAFSYHTRLWIRSRFSATC
jgi:hypothetical protein